MASSDSSIQSPDPIEDGLVEGQKINLEPSENERCFLVEDTNSFQRHAIDSSELLVPLTSVSMAGSKSLMRQSGLEEALLDVQYFEIDPDQVELSPLPDYARGGSCVLRIGAYTQRKRVFPIQVAIKVMSMKNDEEDRVRMAKEFVRELTVWAKLEHDNLLPLRGYYLSRNFEEAWLISEWQYNGNIFEYTRRRNLEVRYNLLNDVLAALEYLHAMNVVHRDIKPGNTLIANNPERAMLCDFGLCKLPSSEFVASLPSLEVQPSERYPDLGTWDHIFTSQTGDLKGTYRYMAPELFRERPPPYSGSSDMWAWACMAHEVVSGEAPYSSYAAILSAVRAICDGCLPGTKVYSEGLLSFVRQLHLCWAYETQDRPTAKTCRAKLAERPIDPKAAIPRSDRNNPSRWVQPGVVLLQVRSISGPGPGEWTVHVDLPPEIYFIIRDRWPSLFLRKNRALPYKELPNFLQLYVSRHAHVFARMAGDYIRWISWSHLGPKKEQYVVFWIVVEPTFNTFFQWSTASRLDFILESVQTAGLHRPFAGFIFEEDAGTLLFATGSEYSGPNPNCFQFSVARRPSVGAQASTEDIEFEQHSLDKFARLEYVVGFLARGIPEDPWAVPLHAFYITYLILVIPGALHRLRTLPLNVLSMAVEIDPVIEQLVESPEDSPEWNDAELRTRLRSLIVSLDPVARHLMPPYRQQMIDSKSKPPPVVVRGPAERSHSVQST